MAAAKNPPTSAPDEQPDEQPGDLDAALARIAELESANADLAAKGSSTPADTAGKVLRWVVTYPAISVVPKDSEGNIAGEAVTLRQGDVLPDDCLWNAGFLQSIGHVTPLAVRDVPA